MKNAGTQGLPVTMYHYVNEFAGSITISPARFEEHCRVLAEKGWRGVSLAEAEAFLIDGEPLPKGSLLLTFDDGFFDNYLFAQPLLHKYGHKGVVFAVSGRLEQGDSPRAALDDVLAGAIPDLPGVRVPAEKTSEGYTLRKDVFLNHAEARAMHEKGILSVASHSRGHYGVFTGPEYKGFFRPRNQSRTFYRTEMEPVWGLPGFAVKAGLKHRAFVPDPELVASVSALVPQSFTGAAEFFRHEEGLKELTALVQGFSDRLGRFETDGERRERMWREIQGGKEELEAVLGAEVRTLCWPWGEYCREALDLAREAGFRLFFTTAEGVNPPGRPLAVHRFKAKDKGGAWLASRAWIYSRPLLGALYAKARI